MVCVLSCALLNAQDSVRLHVHADTLDVRDLVGSADDSYLLQVLGQHSEAYAAKRDSLQAIQDSLRQDSLQERMRVLSFPLTLPLLYQAPSSLHLSDSVPSFWQRPYSAQEGARRYLTTHHADLYTGIAKEYVPQPTEAEKADQSLYELEIPQRSLIKDIEADREEKFKALRNKHNPWYKELNTLLQFTQNYVSPNWYEGGNSNLSMYARVKGYIRYDDKKRIAWETTGEYAAGFTTVKGDTLRKVSVSDDLFRIYSKLGVKIVPKLYGSASVEFRTTLMNTYKPNTRTLKTGAFTPVRLNIALGVDYKPINGLSIVFSPIAYKLVYAYDTLHSPYTTYGIEKGQKMVSEAGSSVRLNWTYKPLREIALQTEFYLYTNYKGVETDLKIDCDFIVNRFISARVSLHPRYDSAAIADGDEKAKIQFKELISIGFAHKFY